MKFRVLTEEEAIAVAKIFKDLEDDMLDSVLDEIKYLASIEPNPEFVESNDDVVEVFMNLIEKHNTNITKKQLKKIVRESIKFIMELKYKYNRPRPYQIAKFYDIDLNGTQLDSMKTPSFPSGHAIQGYLLGEYLSSIDTRNSN